jgi:hypothetical protein
VERIGVKSLEKRNLYVLVVRAPGPRGRVLARLTARRPWHGIEPGLRLRIGDARLRIVHVAASIRTRGDLVLHVLRVATRAVRRRVPANVIAMPRGDDSTIADFLRYHVLVNVYDGDVDRWLRDLMLRDDAESDIRFARLLRARMRSEPALLAAIRRMVDATPLLPALTG